MKIVGTFRKLDKLIICLARIVLKIGKFFGIGVRPIIWLSCFTWLTAMFGVVFSPKVIGTSLFTALITLAMLATYFFFNVCASAIKRVDAGEGLLPDILELSNWRYRLLWYAMMSVSSIAAIPYAIATYGVVGLILELGAAVMNMEFCYYLVLAYAEDSGGTTLKDLVKAGLKKLKQAIRRPSHVPQPC